ncbi:hypothetical protein HY031_03240 [Candidatus Gottesmanbacteria bacterium]|nr:hypothetical protein [Candidatus Gottesmanbacteria bacterium]
MGLDKEFSTCLNGYVSIKTLLARLGRGKKARVSPVMEEQRKFQKEVKEQFVKLKEKGLSIPVFTL